jgi:hypothetical protein
MQFDPDSFTDMGLTNVSSAIVPVVVIGPGCVKYVGTAFNISPDGLFVTAAHVLDGREGAFYWQNMHPGSSIGLIWVASGVGHDDVTDLLGGPLWITSITKYEQPESDLALLRAGVLRNGKPYPLPIVRLSTRFPNVGERISGVGYPNPKVESDISTLEEHEVTLDHSLHVATGEIVEAFENGRDARVMPWPGFQTEAVFESGMSGGPVFNEDGYVCGVISFGLDPNDDWPRYTSYASTALSLFALPITDGQESMTVYEMAKRDLVATDDHFDQLEYVAEDGRVGVRLPRNL